MKVHAKSPDAIGTPSVTVEAITPAEARILLDTAPYAKQRNLRVWYVRTLAEEMRRGEFRCAPAITLGLLPDGRRLLLDGQHRLQAVIEADVMLTTPMVTVPISSEEDAFHVYCNMDTGLARGPGDLAPELKSELHAATTQEVTAAWSAIGLIGSHFRTTDSYERRSRDWRLALLRAFRSDITQVLQNFNAADGETHRVLLRTPVFAIALVTTHWCREAANRFWQSTAENDGLRRNDPRRTLLDYLRRRKATSARRNVEARHVAGTWNAAQADRSHERMSMNTPIYPVEIVGTPYRAGKRDGQPTQIVPTVSEFSGRKVLPATPGQGGRRAATPETANFVTALTAARLEILPGESDDA